MTWVDMPEPCWTRVDVPAGMTAHSKLGWLPVHAKDGVVSFVCAPGPLVKVAGPGIVGSILKDR